MYGFKTWIKICFLLALFISLVPPAIADAPEVGDWRGYVLIDSSIASDGTPVTAHLSNASASSGSTTVGAVENGTGYYLIHVTGTEGSKVDFNVCGIRAPIPSQSWSVGPHLNGTSPYINLSVSKLADGASCSYSCACSGIYCCSGATQYTAGEGTGTCQSSTCSAGGAPATQPPGGGGVVVTTTTTQKKAKPTFWEIATYIDNYYKDQITFWNLIGYISDYYTS